MPIEPGADKDGICPAWATPVPAKFLDAKRVTESFSNIIDQIDMDKKDFLLDHHIDNANQYMGGLLQRHFAKQA